MTEDPLRAAAQAAQKPHAVVGTCPICGKVTPRRQLALAASFTTGADCCPDADPMAARVAELEKELVKTWAETLA